MIRPSTFRTQPRNDYPTSDGKPMAETELHRDLMIALIETLKWHFAAEPSVCVSGNLLIFHEPGNRRMHVSPDVFVVRGVGNHRRDNYLLWEEGRGTLDLVIELTSKTTKKEDVEEKYNLYLNKLGVKEYFLFDPRGEYLEPSFQGYRRAKGRFSKIKAVEGRLPSKVLGLHLEREGTELRLYDPRTGERLLTPQERAIAEQAKAQEERARAEAEYTRAQEERVRAEEQRVRAERAEAELNRLRLRLEQLGLNGHDSAIG